jgi:putative ABC transport system ATP-binding protein
MNTATSAWIELDNVTKRYGPQLVLEAAQLTVERGQMVAVMGRSGSGKSTLLRLIGGLEAADEGVVRVDGIDLTALTETQRARRRRSGLGFVFQSFNLIPNPDADGRRERRAAAGVERRRGGQGTGA